MGILNVKSCKTEFRRVGVGGDSATTESFHHHYLISLNPEACGPHADPGSAGLCLTQVRAKVSHRYAKQVGGA